MIYIDTIYRQYLPLPHTHAHARTISRLQYRRERHCGCRHLISEPPASRFHRSELLSQRGVCGVKPLLRLKLRIKFRTLWFWQKNAFVYFFRIHPEVLIRTVIWRCLHHRIVLNHLLILNECSMIIRQYLLTRKPKIAIHE